jgi:molybdopterin-guanine dinucleotide biosynthesis protein A
VIRFAVDPLAGARRQVAHTAVFTNINTPAELSAFENQR